MSTNLSKYRPAVVRAMQAKGMTSLKALWQEIRRLGYDASLNARYQDVANAAKITGDDKAFYLTEGDHSNHAYAIAFALNAHPEDLFGPAPAARVKASREEVRSGYDAYDWLASGSPDSPLETESRSRAIGRALSGLTPREERVVRLRFGLSASEEEQTLKEVGAQFETDAEHIRRIEVKALRKLKHPMYSRGLRAFIGEEAIAAPDQYAFTLPHFEEKSFSVQSLAHPASAL